MDYSRDSTGASAACAPARPASSTALARPVAGYFIRPRRRLHEVRDGFLHHTLALAELYLQLRQAEQQGRLELLVLETEPRSWRRLADGDWLKPDLHVVVGLGDDALHSFVELDQGTEHTTALLRKL